MFRYWLFGVIISTATISLDIVTGDKECDAKCRALGPISTVKILSHSSTGKYCTCTPDVSAALGSCSLYETWSDIQKKCIPHDDITKGCVTNCPKNCETLIAHKECSKYCYCNKGLSTIEECPSGFHFSKKKIICLPPDDAGCDNISTIGSGLTTSSISRSYSSSSTECRGKCPSTNPQTYTVHLPHENCQKFCKCDWGIPVVMDCPTNLHFNPEKQVCDYPYNANCTGIDAVKI